MFNRKNFLNLFAKSGLTIEELAQKAGVGTVTINRILKHGKKAQMATIGRLANALGCEPEYLLKDEE